MVRFVTLTLALIAAGLVIVLPVVIGAWAVCRMAGESDAADQRADQLTDLDAQPFVAFPKGTGREAFGRTDQRLVDHSHRRSK